jgi:hypothetical protein
VNLLQLQPTIPVECSKGKGQALGWIDYGSEHDIIWIVCLDDTGQCWCERNKFVRVQNNYTMGRNVITEKPKGTHDPSAELKATVLAIIKEFVGNIK